MKKFLTLLLVLISISSTYSIGTETDANSKTPVYNPFKPNPRQNRWYYGGNIGFNFWNNYFYLGVFPWVGYKVSPKFSVGGKIGYTYYKYNNSNFSSNNYGGSIFTRYRVVPQFYLHGEFVYFSYERQTFNLGTSLFGTERVWVPFLLLGGGYSQKVGNNAWIFAEVLFDVIQDSNSPYDNWDPFISFGAGVGF